MTNVPGKVHTGFWDALDALWPQALPAIQAAIAGGADLYITGHSKGAGMAPLAAARLVFENGITPTGVYTFAAPHPGNTDFVAGFPSSVPVMRYEYNLDIVPFLPPTEAFVKLAEKVPLVGEIFKLADGWDYGPVGTLQYIDSKGDIVGEPWCDPTLRFEEIVVKMLEFDIAAIANAHCHLCKGAGGTKCAGGYMAGACPTGVCPTGDC